MARAAVKDLYPPAAGDAALGASFAFVAFAKPKQVAPPIAVHARQALQALVGPVEREVQPCRRHITEVSVVLLHFGHEALRPPGQGFDQHIEAIGLAIVCDVLKSSAVAVVLLDDAVALRAQEPGADARDAGQVVENDVEGAVFGEDPARLEPGIKLVAKYVTDLCFPQQFQLTGLRLHGVHFLASSVRRTGGRSAHACRGSVSISTGKSAAPARGIVFLRSSSCRPALSRLMRT